MKLTQVIITGEKDTATAKMFPTIKLVNNTNLKSESNICFVNTALQLLHSVNRMREFFKMREYRLPNEQIRKMEICNELSRLFSSEGNFFSSCAVLRHLVAAKSGRNHLNDGTQQDTVEFLTTLLNEVEKEISENNWEAKSVLEEFWGIEKLEKKFLNKSNGVCYKCNFSLREEVERFQVLHLKIPDTSSVVTLNGIVENYFSENSEDSKVKCNCCTHKVNCPGTGVCKPKAFASKKVLIKSPDILIVQVNRYLDLTGNKIKTTVWATETIKLPSGDEYTLCSIGHHLGEYFTGGHYLASVKHGDDWFKCNDTQISQSDENNSKSMECNVCIYSKVFSSDTLFTPTDEWQNLQGRIAPGSLHYRFGSRGRNYARNMDNEENLTA